LTAFRGYYRGGNDHTDKGESDDEVMHGKGPRGRHPITALWKSSEERKKLPIQLKREAVLAVSLREGNRWVRQNENLQARGVRTRTSGGQMRPCEKDLHEGDLSG
jgi:hypothetical protein